MSIAKSSLHKINPKSNWQLVDKPSNKVEPPNPKWHTQQNIHIQDMQWTKTHK